jgi:hypothetical protein
MRSTRLCGLRERRAEHREGLREAIARLVHRTAVGVELALRGAAPEAEREPPALEQVVEHAHLLGDHHGVVPGQHDHHRAEVDALGLAGEVGQVLNRAAGHDVRREVVIDRPVRVEPERLDEPAEVQLLLVDLLIGDGERVRAVCFEALPVREVLVVEVHADAHGRLLSAVAGRCARMLAVHTRCDDASRRCRS